MSMRGGSILILLALALTLIAMPAASAYEGPRAWLTEWVKVDFNTDGTLSSSTFSPCNTNPCRYGYVEVSVPNNDTVLQYLHINLSTDYGTNLRSNTTYRGAVASYPYPNDRETVYSNCTPSGVWGDPSVYYNITNATLAPAINLKLEWGNAAGGIDLYDEDNNYLWPGGTLNESINKLVFNFTITNPSATKVLNGIKVRVSFDRDTLNSNNDSVNITESYCAVGGQTVIDVDSDNFNETVEWSGNLNAGQSRTIFFNATWEELINYQDATTSVNFDTNVGDVGMGANYSSEATLTGRTIASKFTRGPIRQGIDLAANPSTGVWRVRGFVTNIDEASPGGGESYLTYNITDWAIYTVNASTGAPLSSANLSGIFTVGEITPLDGRIYTTSVTRSNDTNWLDTQSTSKPYVAVSIDWHVLWNTTNSTEYEGFINATLDLPGLYKIDMVNTQSSNGFISPDTGGENITITVNSENQGDPVGTLSRYIEIYTLIPANATNGNCDGNFTVDVSSIEFYLNSVTAANNLSTSTLNATILSSDPAADCTSDGYVNLTIFELQYVNYTANSTAIGTSLGQSDKIILVFNVTSNTAMTTGDSYDFLGNVTMISDNGTPIMEFIPTETVNVSAKRLIGLKDLKGFDPSQPSLIDADINVTVQDGTGTGISGIIFVDYIPATGVNLIDLATYNTSTSVYKCSPTSCTLWNEGIDYNITDMGNVSLPDGTLVRAFEFLNQSDGNGFGLQNDETIWVHYQMNITHEGLYVLPVIISGYDPLTGLTYSASAVGVIRVSMPSATVPLQINEGDLELARRIIVGNPAVWTKQFDVYNPNPRAVPADFEIEVFPDTTDVSIIYTDEFGKQVTEEILFLKKNGKNYVTWTSFIGALESRSYDIRIMTPPVVEIDRDIEVLGELPDKMVKLKADIYLKSFALEEYKNVILNIPTPYENVIEVRDAFGNQLPFTGGADYTSITIESIGPEEMLSVTVIYRESYPTIIVTPDRDRYNLNSPVSLEILVINGGDRVEYPYVELDVYTPHMASLHSNIQKLGDLEPLEKTELFEKFIIPTTAPTGTYVTNAKFREDFATLASYTGNFYVVGAGPESNLFNAVGIIVILAIIYLVYRRVRSVRKTTRITGIAGTR